MGAADEFIVDSDENGANESPPTEDANNRTFLILASLLTGTLLLISLVAVGFLLMNRSSERAQAVAAIEANTTSPTSSTSTRAPCSAACAGWRPKD